MEEIRYNNLKSELFEQFGSVLGCSQQQATSNPVFFYVKKLGHDTVHSVVFYPLH